MKQGNVDLGVVGGHVDAAVTQDQPDLIERDAMAKHLRSRRVAQQVRALDGRVDPGTPKSMLDHG